VRIAILGAGNVGGGLGAACAAVGHEVVFGVRDPASVKTMMALAAIPEATATTAAEAVEGADVIAFALRWDAVRPTVGTLPSLAGRIVIDAMNRLDGDPGRSTAQDLADLLPGAKIVKAFNTTGFENFTTARSRKGPAAMFVAGDDLDAKRLALDLAEQLGFVPEDVGGLVNAAALEAMVRIWLALAQTHGRQVAFAVSPG
jgi:8-hydroxy-5-deazaflavin:NADPH oxidoreductase